MENHDKYFEHCADFDFYFKLLLLAQAAAKKQDSIENQAAIKECLRNMRLQTAKIKRLIKKQES